MVTVQVSGKHTVTDGQETEVERKSSSGMGKPCCRWRLSENTEAHVDNRMRT